MAYTIANIKGFAEFITKDLLTMRSLAIALCLLASPALADVTGPVRVIDGDTLEIQGQRIRLHGIDAGMSLVGGKADVPAAWSRLPLLAEAVEQVRADRFFATIVLVGRA
jgi:hypothetical protein